MPERDLPELEAKVESGELKISQLSQVQSFIRQEKKSGKVYGQEEKKELLLEVSGKSARETDKVLAEKNPEFNHREKIRAVTLELTQITFTADETLMENLKRIRDLFAHELPAGATHAELIDWMSEKMLKTHAKKTAKKIEKETEKETSPMEFQSKSQSQFAPPTSEVEGSEKSVSAISLEKTPLTSEVSLPPSVSGNILPSLEIGAAPASEDKTAPTFSEKTPSRYIPAEVKREVWTRDQGRCVYVSSETGRVCGSTHRLQVDHRKPFSHGGPSTLENLRILCHAHNQSEARRILGMKERP
jgi:hypothetical protein